MDKKINYFNLKTASDKPKYQHRGDYHKDFTVDYNTFEFTFNKVGYDVEEYEGSTPSGGPDPSSIKIEIYLTEADCVKAMQGILYEGSDEYIEGDTLYGPDGEKICTANELCDAAHMQIRHKIGESHGFY
jgi:hypothetical protein